jgi:hypothetical protein
MRSQQLIYIEEHCQTKTVKEMAKALGLSYAAVNYWVKKKKLNKKVLRKISKPKPKPSSTFFNVDAIPEGTTWLV